MNEVPSTRAAIPVAPGGRRPAGGRPDDSFLEAVQSLLAGGEAKVPSRANGETLATEPPDMPWLAETDDAGEARADDGRDLSRPDLLLAALGAYPTLARGADDRLSAASPSTAGSVHPAIRYAETAVPDAAEPGRLPRASRPELDPFTFADEATAGGNIAEAIPRDADFAFPTDPAVPRLTAAVARVETHFAPQPGPTAAIGDPEVPLWTGPDPAGTRPAALSPAARKIRPLLSDMSPPATLAGAARVLPAPATAKQPPVVGETLPLGQVEAANDHLQGVVPERVNPRLPPSSPRRPETPDGAADGPSRTVRVAPEDAAPVSTGALPQLSRSELPRVSAALAAALDGTGQTPISPTPGGQPAPLRVVTLTLDPEHLGRVQLTIRLKGERLALHVVAERPETAELIEQDSEALTRLLDGDGFDVESLTASAMRDPGGLMPAAPAFAAATSVADPGSEQRRPSSHQPQAEDRGTPSHDSPQENGSSSHEEVDATGRSGRLYV